MKRKSKIPKMPPMVCIEWLDAFGGSKNEWQDISKLTADPRPVTVRTVGYLLHDGRYAKRVISSLTDMDHPESSYGGDGEMVIGVGSIVKIRRLKI